jgi:predicted negative regulator of RcsB-dependent stress response
MKENIANQKLIAIELMNHHQLESAFSIIIQELKNDKFWAQGWVLLGDYFFQTHQKLSAIASYERASMLDPKATWKSSVDNKLRSINDSETEINPLLRELLSITS